MLWLVCDSAVMLESVSRGSLVSSSEAFQTMLGPSASEEFRNGLVHEGRLKNGGQFSLERGATAELVNGILLVNPKCLAAEVRSALDAYVDLAKGDEAERAKLGSALWHDLEDDFRLLEE